MRCSRVRSRSSLAGPADQAHQPPEGVPDLADQRVEVGRRGLGGNVVGVLGRLGADGRVIEVLGAAQQLNLTEAGLRIEIGRGLVEQ